ncbi:MAG: PHP domain-containing protein [Desulfovermiculus sp.]|nr:PHP domain-containing protein [Desulfovermiculus sp.]
MSEIDLHTHSTASDGSLTPDELVHAGKEAGLLALALTDHDTVSGLDLAVCTGKEIGLEVIPGCELSVQSTYGFMHILGLWVSPRPSSLQTALDWMQDKRWQRNEKMLAALRSLGISIENTEVKEEARGESVGRPHIAQVLVRKGVVGDMQEAFVRFIGSNGSAYIPKVKLTAGQAISALKGDQATVILAHPYSLDREAEELESELRRLKSLGLDGVEVYYPDHNPEQTDLFARLTTKLDLLPSGGSDFHGRIKPDIRLGVGRGDLSLSYGLLEKMKTARRMQGLPGVFMGWHGTGPNNAT